MKDLFPSGCPRPSEDISLRNIRKNYGAKRVFDGLSLSIGKGKILCVVGESGGGKTTLLNILAGLVPFEGEISGKPDKISYIFQEPRLIPALTVRKNLEYAGGGSERIEKLLRGIGLSDCAEKRSSQLSGGEKQRVSFARAFLDDGDEESLLLMDEPFSSLDTALKIRLAGVFSELWQNGGGRRTAVFVTHDPEEALMLSDRILLLRGGKIIADFPVLRDKFPSPYGAPSELRERLLAALLRPDFVAQEE